jgi:CDP-diacylglycerol--glycerol-3-phosphate 3-phosphatidyltransferase
MRAANFLTLPNILTLSRLPLAVVLFVCIAQSWWWTGLAVFGVAALTDWLDGLAARRLNQLSALGRNLDPLIDKVLTGGAFIYLLPVEGSGLMPWMVVVIVGRELLVTGLRGIMESHGIRFGADLWGKIKMVLQCAVLVVILAVFAMKPSLTPSVFAGVQWVQKVLLYLMLIATLFSGLQYLRRAVYPPPQPHPLRVDTIPVTPNS